MRSGGRGVDTSSTALSDSVPLYFLHFLRFSFSNYASSGVYGCFWVGFLPLWDWLAILCFGPVAVVVVAFVISRPV